MLFEFVSVARVQPRTSKGITDLLLPHFHSLNVNSPFKKYLSTKASRIHRKSSAPPVRECQDPPLLHPYRRLVPLVNKLRSRSLSELTRQITPPTKNGHAPPPIEIKKELSICQSLLCPDLVSFSCWVKLSRRLHSWWCPSVNSFKFQPCDHTPPGAQRLNDYSQSASRVVQITPTDPWPASFTVKTTTVSDRLRSPNFRS